MLFLKVLILSLTFSYQFFLSFLYLNSIYKRIGSKSLGPLFIKLNKEMHTATHETPSDSLTVKFS
jgi:hypothetical protein